MAEKHEHQEALSSTLRKLQVLARKEQRRVIEENYPRVDIQELQTLLLVIEDSALKAEQALFDIKLLAHRDVPAKDFPDLTRAKVITSGRHGLVKSSSDLFEGVDGEVMRVAEEVVSKFEPA